MVQAKHEVVNEKEVIFLLSGRVLMLLSHRISLVNAVQFPMPSGIVWDGSVMVHNKCKMINNKKDNFTFWQGL